LDQQVTPVSCLETMENS